MIEPQLQFSEKDLRVALKRNPSDWETRKKLARIRFDRGAFEEAADPIWEAESIPATNVDLAFAARILSKNSPRRSIRLLACVMELNRGSADKNVAMAGALLHQGLVIEAARFYGAALECDTESVHSDLDHFFLWTDDERSLWGDFSGRQAKLGELPWMSRDPLEARKLSDAPKVHTTPVAVPALPRMPGEQIPHARANPAVVATPPPNAQRGLPILQEPTEDVVVHPVVPAALDGASGFFTTGFPSLCHQKRSLRCRRVDRLRLSTQRPSKCMSHCHSLPIRQPSRLLRLWLNPDQLSPRFKPHLWCR